MHFNPRVREDATFKIFLFFLCTQKDAPVIFFIVRLKRSHLFILQKPKGATMQLKSNEKEILIHLYKKSQLAVDRLPYSHAFERLYGEFISRTNQSFSKAEVFRSLLNLRKKKQLPTKKAS
jgi:hypothetical protein